MNVYYAENDILSLGVKEMGAELTSLRLKKTGREYIWYGNPDIWYGQSPILFPFIGRLLDDKYRVNGSEYTCPKHGIVRKKPFILTEKTDTSLTFLQSEDEQSLTMYPYKFNLYVTYSLDGDKLTAVHRVENTNDTAMYFSIGAHPGFNCSIGDVLLLSEAQTVRTERIDSESILMDKTFPVLNNGKEIPITKDIFEKDALILSGLKGGRVTLKGSGYFLEFNFFDAPVMGIWAKPGAPYVCLEPWFGINDSYDKKDDISQKRGIMSLDPGKSFTFKWEAKPGITV